MTLPCLWFSEIPSVPPSDWLSFLGSDELARYHSATAPRRKLHFLAARVLLRRALSAEFGAHPKSFSITATEGESPRILKSLRPVQASLSHTESACVVLISESACGVDIENCSVDRDFNGLAKTAFGPEALALFEKAPHRESFYALWTSKEARYKAGQPCAWEGRLSIKNYRVCATLPLTGLKKLVIC